MGARTEPPPTAPTVDAPPWLRPGASSGEAQVASPTPPDSVAEGTAERPATRAPEEAVGAPGHRSDALAPGAAGTEASPESAEPPARQAPRARDAGAGAPERRDPPLRRIGQFVLLERIGAGGMGEVLAAFDDKLERKVAIKLVATRGSDERARQRLLREAQALARLSHPNVVTVYEAGTLPDGGLFIAMELVKGETLRAWQRRPGRTWREIAAIYAEAGRGLAAAHQTGIIHRDFKPDNVLVGDDGRVRVADFGLALATDAAAPRDPPPPGAARASAPRLTAAGRFAGTPGYMAPEQLAGAAVDARADQYSFCAALYEALVGQLPDPLPDDARARGEPDPAHPRWLRELVARGLGRDPGDRFTTMDALLAELTRGRGRTRRRALAALAVALAIATGAAAMVSRDRGPPPCPLATAELAGVWDGPARQRSEAAILGTGAPFAPRVWASTAAALDHHAQRWLGAQRAACEATRVHHVQSAALLDRRMECLAARRRSLAAAAGVLQQQPAQAIAHPGALLASLGDLEPCADTAVLFERSAAGGEPAPAHAAGARQQLANAGAHLAAGDVAGAAAAVAEAERLTAGAGAGALAAELAYAQGRLAVARGEAAAASAALRRAVAQAVSSHDDELPIDAWLTLATAPGSEQRPAEVAAWLAEADAWLHRLGHAGDSRRIVLGGARAGLLRRSGDPAGAVAALSVAIGSAEALWGKDDPRLIALLCDRAAARGELHQATAAVADAERAAQLGTAAWGAEHPDTERARQLTASLRAAVSPEQDRDRGVTP
ncbi:MAG TPA: protein kinase [Kofleriaceae bacterium]|jgi:hypothetical protein|nr:protein kinase [Kofleriaceae bacterium]